MAPVVATVEEKGDIQIFAEENLNVPFFP